MTRFKLKPGITFQPQGSRYLVIDEESQSTFRVGEVEYRILKQFEETTNVEEVSYWFRMQQGVDLSYENLLGFTEKAAKLNLLRPESESIWSRISPHQSITFQARLFDPNPLLNFLIRKARLLFNGYGLSLMCVVLLSTAWLLV
ncbi:MAG TPA: hypothetical protein VNI02_20310, partial [Blastocatellia bacterium]|nr:hypothetical protein [Blastocatellia bacterium]